MKPTLILTRVLRGGLGLLVLTLLGPVGAGQLTFKGIYLTRVAPEPDGAILTPIDLEIDAFSTVVRGLNDPENVACGPDGRLYVTEIGVQDRGRTVHRLLRYTRQGSGRTVLVRWEADRFRPSTLAFNAEGDLFIGSTSLAEGGPTQGLWVLPAAVEIQRVLSPPQQLLPAEAFLPPDNGTLYGVRPLDLLRSGPYAGDLLVIDAPVQAFTPGGRVLRALAPDFRRVTTFIPAHLDPDSGEPFKPAGLAVTPEGEVLISDFTNDKILRYSATGELLGTFAELSSPNQLAVAAEGTVYATNVGFRGRFVRGMLFVYDPQGNLLAEAGGSFLLRGVTVCP